MRGWAPSRPSTVAVERRVGRRSAGRSGQSSTATASARSPRGDVRAGRAGVRGQPAPRRAGGARRGRRGGRRRSSSYAEVPTVRRNLSRKVRTAALVDEPVGAGGQLLEEVCGGGVRVIRPDRWPPSSAWSAAIAGAGPNVSRARARETARRVQEVAQVVVAPSRASRRAGPPRAPPAGTRSRPAPACRRSRAARMAAASWSWTPRSYPSSYAAAAGPPYQGGQFVGVRAQRVRAVLVQEAGGEVLGAVDRRGLGRQLLVPVRAGRGERRVGDREPVVGAGERRRRGRRRAGRGSGRAAGCSRRTGGGRAGSSRRRPRTGRCGRAGRAPPPGGRPSAGRRVPRPAPGRRARAARPRCGGPWRPSGRRRSMCGPRPGRGGRQARRATVSRTRAADGGQPFGAAGAGVGEGLLAGRERLVHLGRACSDSSARKSSNSANRDSRFSNWSSSLGSCSSQRRGVRGGQRAGDRLPEQGELGGELRPPLVVEELPAAGVERGAGPVRHRRGPRRSAPGSTYGRSRRRCRARRRHR